MANKKKIALLNMQFDNNYGGSLQRYAMVTILRRMGYDVEYLYMRMKWGHWSLGKCYKKIIKQVIKHYVLQKDVPLFPWQYEETIDYRTACKPFEQFLERYIPHSKQIYNHDVLEKTFSKGKYDALIIGSDQVWRKQYVEYFGLGTWFGDFTGENYEGKKIVYAASFGVDNDEYTSDEAERLNVLFQKFNAVSVRESTGLELLKMHQWTTPTAMQTLDPTLLLTKDDYLALIKSANTKPMEGNMFCYILDGSDEKLVEINAIARERHLKPFLCTVIDRPQVSIEQWLRFFMDADYVYTDSYHGFLFSLIFDKPYHLVRNKERGNARFETVEQLLQAGTIEQKKIESLNFLKNAIG